MELNFPNIEKEKISPPFSFIEKRKKRRSRSRSKLIKCTGTRSVE
jgi:hypothetical protein